MNVQSILGSKGVDVATIEPSASVSEAIAELAQRGIGALVVSDDGRTIVGILSERDIVRSLGGDGSTDHSVAELMSTDVVTCRHGDGVDALMSMMTGRRIRHLPVVDDDGHLAGLISIGDVVKARLAQLEHENAALSDYITGR